jgi:hypothetical protein
MPDSRSQGRADHVLAYYGALQQACDRAEAAVDGWIEHHLRIAGRCVRLRFAGQGLVTTVVPALAHLAYTSPSGCDLSVCLWESRSTGISPPTSPWPSSACTRRGEIQGAASDRIRVSFDVGSGVLSLYDRALRRAVVWCRDPDCVPASYAAAPLRTVLHWWAHDLGGQLAHAAAVGADAGAVLLTGRSGSGKSTSTLSCLDAGLGYLGDDYVLLTLDGGPRVHSLYNSAKANVDYLRRALPHWSGRVDAVAQDEQKAVMFLHRHVPDQLRSSLAIRAIVLPRVAQAARTALRRVSQAECFRALAPTTLNQLPHGQASTSANLAAVAKALPAYALDLGRDIPAIPRLLETLLQDARPMAA